jgi:Protein of unknown function (DUF3313)
MHGPDDANLLKGTVMRIATWAMGVLVGLSVLAGGVAAQQNSGFLGNAYPNLKDTQSPSGAKLKRWIAPNIKPASYEFVLLQKTVFYPEPKSTDQVSTATLNEISAYLDEALRRELTGVVQLATQPGPKTLRFRPAITAAAAKSLGLKPYQYIPVAFVVTKAVGMESKGAALAVEFDAQDVETNRVVAAGMREGTGVELKRAGEQLTLAHFKPLIDNWAKDLRATVESSKIVKPAK